MYFSLLYFTKSCEVASSMAVWSPGNRRCDRWKRSAIFFCATNYPQNVAEFKTAHACYRACILVRSRQADRLGLGPSWGFSQAVSSVVAIVSADLTGLEDVLQARLGSSGQKASVPPVLLHVDAHNMASLQSKWSGRKPESNSPFFFLFLKIWVFIVEIYLT